VLLTHHKRRAEAPGLNMAAMIDVVFLLLVFFMCTSSYGRPERDLPTRLPQVGGAPAETEFDPVRVRLWPVAGGTLVTCDGTACRTLADLSAQLRARRAIADVPVIIQGEAGVPFGQMVAALDACYGADLRRVAFSAATGER